MTNICIDLKGIHKQFGRKVTALQGVDIQVHNGEIFGLLGPNGAGKSTLVKIMMTVVRPTAGSGTILGKPLGDKKVLCHIGYLPEHHRFPSYMTGRQVLQFYSSLSLAKQEGLSERIDQLLEMVQMTEACDRKISGYSKGMLQRVGLAQALVADPDLLMLDEPTDGLDPVGRRNFRDIVVRLKNEGKTIIINSHLLGELEMVCDRVAIMNKGIVKKQGLISDLTSNQSYYELSIENPNGKEWWKVVDECFGKIFESQPNATGSRQARFKNKFSMEIVDDHLRLDTDQIDNLQEVIDELRRANLNICEIKFNKSSLEDFFIDVVGQKQGD